MQITPLINSLQNSRYFFAFFKRETVEWSAGHAPSTYRACTRLPSLASNTRKNNVCYVG